jgi:hypothetical protein
LRCRDTLVASYPRSSNNLLGQKAVVLKRNP